MKACSPWRCWSRNVVGPCCVVGALSALSAGPAAPQAQITPPDAPAVDTVGDAEKGADAPSGRANWTPLVPQGGLLIRLPVRPPGGSSREPLDLYVRINPKDGTLLVPPIVVLPPPEGLQPEVWSPDE